MTTEATIETPRIGAELNEANLLRSKLVRKVARTRFAGKVTYRNGSNLPDPATAENLGHGDISLESDRMLIPGEMVYLELDCLKFRGEPVTLETEVVSSRRVYDRRCFVSIVHIR